MLIHILELCVACTNELYSLVTNYRTIVKHCDYYTEPRYYVHTFLSCCKQAELR